MPAELATASRTIQQKTQRPGITFVPGSGPIRRAESTRIFSSFSYLEPMACSLSPGPETFTVDQLHAVWREGQLARGKRSLVETVQYDANNDLKYMRKFCLDLQASVQDPLLHKERIDAAFAPFLVAHFPENVSADAVCVFFGILQYHMSFPVAARVHSVPLPHITAC